MVSGNEVEGVEKIADLATVESSFKENNTNTVTSPVEQKIREHFQRVILNTNVWGIL